MREGMAGTGDYRDPSPLSKGRRGAREKRCLPFPDAVALPALVEPGERVLHPPDIHARASPAFLGECPGFAQKRGRAARQLYPGIFRDD